MYGVDLYRRIRLVCHHDGLSQREAARRFGVNRRTVSKALLHSVPPGYRRKQAARRPKLGPFTGIIEPHCHARFIASPWSHRDF